MRFVSTTAYVTMSKLYFSWSNLHLLSWLSLEQATASLLSFPVADLHPTPSTSVSLSISSLWPHGLYSPWTSPGKKTGVHSLSLLQGIFPTQGWNPGLPNCRWILYKLSHKGSPLPQRTSPISPGRGGNQLSPPPPLHLTLASLFLPLLSQSIWVLFVF